jgi:uncharacterized membrane protein YeiB
MSNNNHYTGYLAEIDKVTRDKERQAKGLTRALIFVLLAIVLLFASRPSDERCRQLVAERAMGRNIVSDYLGSSVVARYVVIVEDYGLFKGVYSADGQRLGIGIVNTVIFF